MSELEVNFSNMPDDIRPLFEEVRSHQTKLSEAEVAHASLVAQRDAVVDFAVREAEASFQNALQKSQEEIEALRQANSDKSLKEGIESYLGSLDHIDATALALMIQNNGRGDDFLRGFKDFLGGNNSWQAGDSVRVLEKFEVFHDFHEQLAKRTKEGRGLPVVIMDLRWFEREDFQAAWEGRPSGTGKFCKNITAEFGHVRPEHLTIINQPHDEDSFLAVNVPTGIKLFVQVATEISGEYDMGDLELQERQVKQPHIEMLVSTKFTSGKISWLKSRDLDFSLKHESFAGQPIRDGRTRFFLYGQNVKRGLEKLIDDPEVAAELKIGLRNRLEELSQT